MGIITCKLRWDYFPFGFMELRVARRGEVLTSLTTSAVVKAAEGAFCPHFGEKEGHFDEIAVYFAVIQRENGAE